MIKWWISLGKISINEHWWIWKKNDEWRPKESKLSK
jgi:hypothetical protein